MAHRKAFNFYASYYEIAEHLSDKDRLAWYDALMNRQFNGIEPNLKGQALFAYISQKHSIDSQIKGFEDKKGEKITPLHDPTQGGTQGGTQGPSVQEKEKEKEKVQYVIPALSDFLAYALEKKPNVDVEAVKLKHEAWKENNWVNGNGKHIKNWKSNLLNVLQYLPEKQKPKSKNTSSGIWQ